jgi:non-ribosomal peptide synthase protein (TIGR01720 family)
LCRGDGRPDLLLLSLHPLVADRASWRILLEDLDTAIRQLLEGREPELPAAGSFRRWAEQTSGAARPEAAAPVPATSALVGAPDAARVSSLIVPLGPARTRQLLDEVPAAYHTQTPEVLLAAVARASARCGRRGPLWVELHEPAAAPPVPPRTVGCFTVSRVVRLELPDLPPGEALRLAKEQIRASRPGGGPFASHSAIEVAVSFESLADLTGALSSEGPLRYCPERMPTGGDALVPAPRTLHLAGVAAPGGLELHWRWCEPEPARSEVEVLARETFEALLELIVHCRSGAGGYTPSDFGQAHISQKDLDKLVTRLRSAGQEEWA